MEKNLLFEPFPDGMQINDVDLVQSRHIFYCGTEHGESLWKKRSGPGDGDVDVGVGVSFPFGPRTEPDDFNLSTQHASRKLRNILRNLAGSSEKLLRNHGLSVSVLGMMSTAVAGKLNEIGKDV